MNTTPRIGSLCSGYGGLDMGISAVTGGETVWVSDIEPAACTILERRFPTATNIGDMTKVDWSQVEPVEILCGGTPCQDLSQAGRRAGMREGTRSNLWESMRDAIEVIRPRLVVWENVRGALSAEATSDSDMEQRQGSMGDGRDAVVLRALGRVLGDISEIGYDAEWTTVPASGIGAPHRRERVFLIAWPIGTTPNALCSRSRGGAEESEQARCDDAPIGSDQGGNRSGENQTMTLLPTPRATRGGSATETLELLPTPSAYDGSRGGSQDPSKRRAGGHQPSIADVVEHTDFGHYAPAIELWETITGRAAPAPSELNVKGKHRLSARFVEWMMGLEIGWVSDDEMQLTRNQQLKALGNGVVPQQASAAISDLIGSN